MSGIYWLASYPKSGNTWFRSFLANFQQDGDVPVDINELSTGQIASSRGWLDEVLGFDTADLSFDEVDQMRPAIYRWSEHGQAIGYHKVHDAYTVGTDHEPMFGRDSTLGAIYIVRNPLDVVLSAASHWQTSVDETIQKMADPAMALANKRHGLAEQVRQRLLGWSEHVLSWVDAPGLNRMVIRYEDMLADPVTVFAQAVDFLQLPTEPQRIAKAVRFSDFKVLAQQEVQKGFKERPGKVDRFFRQGQSGGWRDRLTPQQVSQVVARHGAVMRRFGYWTDDGQPAA